MLNFFLVYRIVAIEVILESLLVVPQILCLIPELVPFRDELGNLDLIVLNLRRMRLVAVLEVLDFKLELVTRLLCRADVFNCVIERRKFVLQVVDAVLHQLLGHSLVEVDVIQLFAAGQRVSKLLLKLLAHLLRDQTHTFKRLLLFQLALEHHLMPLVNFDLHSQLSLCVLQLVQGRCVCLFELLKFSQRVCLLRLHLFHFFRQVIEFVLHGFHLLL